MVQRSRSEAKVSKSDKIPEDDLLAEAGAAEINVSKSVIVDESENNTLSQSEYEVQTTEEAEKEKFATSFGCSKVDSITIDAEEAEKEYNATLDGCSKADNNTRDAAEDEHIHEEHSAEEVEMELGEEKREEGLDEYGDDVDFDVNDNYDVDDDDDFDEGEEGLDDYDDDNGDNVEVADYDDGDGDGDEEEEDDYLMKEEEEEIDETTKLENNDNKAVKESDQRQRNRVAQGEKEEIAKEENKRREGGSLKEKGKTLREVKERKKVAKEVSDKVASKHKDKQEEYGQGDAMVEADRGNAKEDIHDKEGSSKQKVKILRKSSSRKRVAARGSGKVASKRDDKVESSRRKKVKSMGMIFMCSSKTKKDCYHYKVLGLPANKRDVVGKIYIGMRLFLYDVDLKLLYGIYKAAGRGGYNIQPKAFNSQFPSQVRFTVLEDCLPLAEEKFKKVIKDNYFTKTKFDCQLTSQQVKNLCKLFVFASKGSKAIRSAGKVKTRASTDQDRSRGWREERQSALTESTDQDRSRGWREERQSALTEKRRYHEHSRNREREVVAPAVASVPIRFMPTAAAPVPSYAYDRTLELDAYRQDLLVEHHDSHRHPVPEPRLEHPIVYRRDPLPYQLDSYRWDVAAAHLDSRLRDEIGRHDPYISYRERPERRDLRSRDDFGRHDPYFSYRGNTEDHDVRPQDEFRRQDPYLSFQELPAHRDRTDLLTEPVHYRAIHRSEYTSAVAPLPEYHSAHSLYRY